MPETAQKQASGIPRWEMLAAAVPVVDAVTGGARIRAVNHLGHTVDLYFSPALWRWATALSQASDSVSVSGVVKGDIPPATAAGGIIPRKR